MRDKTQHAVMREVRVVSLGLGFMGAGLMALAFGGLLSNDSALAGAIKPAVLLLGSVGCLLLWCGGIGTWFQGMSNLASDAETKVDDDATAKG